MILFDHLTAYETSHEPVSAAATKTASGEAVRQWGTRAASAAALNPKPERELWEANVVAGCHCMGGQTQAARIPPSSATTPRLSQLLTSGRPVAYTR